MYSVQLGQVYSNTRVLTQVNTSTAQVNTNQQEPNTSQQESTVRHQPT